MHDLFVCSQSLHKRVRDCEVVDDGADSDHDAICIKLAITSIKFKGSAITKGVIDWTSILNDERYKELYNHHLRCLVNENTSYDDFNQHIMTAGEFTATLVKEKCEGWFQFNRQELAPIIEQRNKTQHLLKRTSPDCPLYTLLPS